METLAENGLYYGQMIPACSPLNFDPELGLRIIGYDTKNLPAAIKAKLHYIHKPILYPHSMKTINTIYAIYKKNKIAINTILKRLII
jgi:N-acetylmuramoyl-L-alanine amidase